MEVEEQVPGDRKTVCDCACFTENKVTRQCNCSPQLSPAYSALENGGRRMITVASPGPATLLKSISHKISVRAAGVGLWGMAFKDEEPGSSMDTQ